MQDINEAIRSYTKLYYSIANELSKELEVFPDSGAEVFSENEEEQFLALCGVLQAQRDMAFEARNKLEKVIGSIDGFQLLFQMLTEEDGD